MSNKLTSKGDKVTKMKALILAAGPGRKFFPFSYFRPKPMFPICNRPLLEYTVKELVETGIKEIGIVVGHRKGRILNHFGDGSPFGCRITYIHQDNPAGTADAVLQAEAYVSGDDVLVIYGDVLFDTSVLHHVLQAFKKTMSLGVIGLKEVKNPESHISVKLEDGKVTDYRWKAPGLFHGWCLPSNKVIVGIYAFKSEVLNYLKYSSGILQKVFSGVFPPEEYEIADILPVLTREGKALEAVVVDGEVLDVDKPWEILKATQWVFREMTKDLKKSQIAKGARISPEAKIDGIVSVGEGSTISEDVYIEGPIWIGRNTRVLEGSHIYAPTVIGDNCTIGPYCSLSGSIANGCEIGYLAKVKGVVLDHSIIDHAEVDGVFGERFDPGEGTLVGNRRFDDEEPKVMIQGVLRDTGGWSSGVFVGDYCRTGVGAMLMPGRIIGPCSIVGPGVIVTKNVAPYKAVFLKQELKIIDWRPQIYDR